MHWFALPFEEIADADCEQIDDSNSRSFCDDRGERLLMWIVSVGGEQNELLEPRRFPRIEEVIEHSVQRLFSNGSVSGEDALCRGVHPIFDRGRSEHAELCGEIISESVDNDGV